VVEVYFCNCNFGAGGTNDLSRGNGKNIVKLVD
jgi:hypothetical protein